MPAMRCNRASLMQTKMHQFSTMEASFTLNIGNHKHKLEENGFYVHVSLKYVCLDVTCSVFN